MDHALDVDVEQLVYVLVRQGAERGQPRDPGVGEDDIDMSLLCAHGAVEPVEITLSGDVALYPFGVWTDQGDGRVEFDLSTPDDEDEGALAHEGLGGGEADAPGPARDDGDFPIELAHVVLLRSSEVWIEADPAAA